MKTLLAIALVLLAGCDRKPEAPVISEQTARAMQAAQVSDSTRQHMQFLNQLRQDDALSSAIHRTTLTEEKQIGVVLYSTVKPEAVAGLMRWALTEMAHKFPGEDVSILVFMTATPPQKIGEARLDGKTGEISYTASDMQPPQP